MVPSAHQARTVSPEQIDEWLGPIEQGPNAETQLLERPKDRARETQHHRTSRQGLGKV